MSATPRTETLRWAMENRELTPREDEILTAMQKLEIELNQYKAEFLRHVEAASIFQPGGSLYNEAKGSLRLGGSTVVQGIAWLVSERERLMGHSTQA